MADQTPVPEQTSYSDPVHDRVEGILRFFAKRWQVWVLGVAGIAIGVAAWNYLKPGSPEAASASALLRAENAEENRDGALATVSKDAGILPQFRVHAALSLAKMRLEAGQIEPASEALDAADAALKALKQSAGEGEARRAYKQLVAIAALTRSAVYERQGRLQEALDQAELVAGDVSSGYDYGNADAVVRAALLRLALAETAPATAAAELRLKARDDLAAKKDQRDAEMISSAATWTYHDLLRRHPELAAGSTASSLLDRGSLR
jgi:hypothetical protein